MTEEFRYWHDKDVKPYVEGENACYDAVMHEIVEKALERLRTEEAENRSTDRLILISHQAIEIA